MNMILILAVVFSFLITLVAALQSEDKFHPFVKVTAFLFMWFLLYLFWYVVLECAVCMMKLTLGFPCMEVEA